MDARWEGAGHVGANPPQIPITGGSAPALGGARLQTPGRLSGSGSALPKPQGPRGGAGRGSRRGCHMATGPHSLL